ncbi:MAG: hypothetical protein RLP44_06970 [Aggregatilineales bacterium]
MRRLGLLIFFALPFMMTFAQDDAPIRIDWTSDMTVVSGTVQITGTVNPEGLQSYFLEIAPYEADSAESSQWIPVSLPSTVPIVNEVLLDWNTLTALDGVYQLRLHVRLSGGESVYYTLAPITIANDETVDADGQVEVIERPPNDLVLATPPEPELVPPPETVNELPLEVGGHVVYFNETTQDLMHEAGMTWVKWQISYSMNDENTLNVIQDRINTTHAAGFQILLSVLGDVNELTELGEDYYPIYAEFLGQVAALNPGAIEVWNEMNLEREWPRGRINPQSYVDMLSQAYTSIKAVNPNVMVITGALAPTGAEGAFGSDRVWNDDRYTQGMVNAGAADYADCIGIHYNEGVIPPNLSGGDPRDDNYPTRYLPLMLDRVGYPFRNTDIPLCFTELGYLSPDGFDAPLNPNFGWAGGTTVAEQSEWLAQAIQIAADYQRLPVRLLIVWNVDFDRYDDDPQGGYAIIRPDGSCPACETIGALRVESLG